MLEKTKKFENTISKIIKRCEANKIKCEFNEENGSYNIELPAGREKRTITVANLSSAKKLLQINIEQYRFISDYLSICSYELGTIEALIEPLVPMSRSFFYRKLFGKYHEDDDKEQFIINLSSPDSDIKISIGPPSKEFDTLMELLEYIHFTPITIKITALNINDHDKTVNLLKTLSNSVFFQIDLLMNLPITLSKLRKRIPKRVGKSLNSHEFKFPKFHYNNKPTSLYWYARSAVEMPLLQYLAFYQAIEYYFPIYAEVEAKRTIRNIIKNPTFSENRDTDIAKLITAVKSKIGKGYDSEKNKLKYVFNECLNIDDIKEFFKFDQKRETFFSEDKKISKHKLTIKQTNNDFLNNIVERVYEIRCKIVHTKANDLDDDIELLLPFSREAELLSNDIELIKFICQQVLIFSGEQLNLR